MRRFLILALLPTLLLVGCGGSSSDGGSNASGGGGDSSSAGTFMGQRELPSASVSVWRLDPLVAGQDVRFSLQIAGTGLETVEVLQGSDYGSALPTVVGQEADGSWLITATVPDPMPTDSGLLVSLGFSDGSTQECGIDDFGF